MVRNWLAFLYFTFFSTAMAGVVINEIHYDPDKKTENVEFIELHNPDSAVVNLSNWAFDSGISYTFPVGTSLPAGGYLVIAANPSDVQSKFGVAALGPWEGKLRNEGETIRLVDSLGNRVLAVDYSRGFPWPVVGDAPGYSIELANPFHDPDVGGNWRRSDGRAEISQTLIAADEIWRYQNGQNEFSTPPDAWRQPGFDDSGWPIALLPAGTGEADLNTTLSNVVGNDSGVAFRKTFTVAGTPPANLQLHVRVDDGFTAWLNGTFVASFNMPSETPAFDDLASQKIDALDWRIVNIPASATLQSGENSLAIQVHNATLNSPDLFLNARLHSLSTRPGPTPGAINSTITGNLPPRVRQVRHRPEEPTSNTPVTISAKVTDLEDGVDTVRLAYQIVDPGQYIALDDPAFPTTWTFVAMTDPEGDDTYEAILPAGLQVHRRLLRYRIFATDNGGQTLQAPPNTAPVPNFALFTYDGIPAWEAAIEPGSTPVQTFNTNITRALPAYHLISKQTDIEASTWLDRYPGDDFRWSGTLVHDGDVYDHITFRADGDENRYTRGKNNWSIDFHADHPLRTRNDWGQRYDEDWNRLNLSSAFQEGDLGQRGEHGMFEAVSYRLFNLMDVESPFTHFAQLRVIDDASEAGPDQYNGDFWGLYLAIEAHDGGFLDEHALPDGNLYEMEGATGPLVNQGATNVTDRSDLNTFVNTFTSTPPNDPNNPNDAWWRANLDLPRYLSYRSVLEGIHHYDVDGGANVFLYRNPSTAWQPIPGDLTRTWADTMPGSGDEAFAARVLPRSDFAQEYQNRLRSFRDLIFNDDQGFALLDDTAALIDAVVAADRARWDFDPILGDPMFIERFADNKAGTGRYYESTGSFAGMVQHMKDYITSRSAWIDSNFLADPDIPQQPTIIYNGPAGFPVDGLAFLTSPFADATGSASHFEWRIGEVTATNSPAYEPGDPEQYEVTAVWHSGAVPPDTFLNLPPSILEAGRSYRVRVRHVDSTNKASHWSDALEFIAGPPSTTTLLLANLRVSEVMYNSRLGSDFDYLEFVNTNPVQSLDLSNVLITDGVEFIFPTGTILGPTQHIVVAKAPGAGFDGIYGTSDKLVLGPYDGNLNNGGERVRVTLNGGLEVLDFTYNDAREWPCAADGPGHSLVPLVYDDQRGPLDIGRNWRRSRFIDGSPGTIDPELPRGVVINEFAAHTDLSDPNFPDYDSNDWIELYNRGEHSASLTGLHLSDDPNGLDKWAIPGGTLAPGEWTSYDEISGFHSPITSGFGLNKAGEKLFLTRIPTFGRSAVIDCLCFEGQANGLSAGRFPDGTAGLVSMPLTRGEANLPPTYDLVFSEIMYNPGTNAPTFTEFVEITNPLTNAVLLFSQIGSWSIDGTIDYTFPNGTFLLPNETILLVPFNPLDSVTLDAFAATYGVTLPPQVFGPYSGSLNNRTGRLTLQSPQAPDVPGDSISQITRDEVIYGDDLPWDPDADGTSDSLHRISVNLDGDQPGNWTASVPTPGTSAASAFNWPPELALGGPFPLLIDEAFAFTNTVTDWNIDQVFAFQLLPGAPAGLTLNGPILEWTPTATELGTHIAVVQVTDNGTPPLSATQAFTFVVGNGTGAAPPVFTSPGTLSINEEEPWSLTLDVSDPDGPSDPLSYTLENGPADMSLNPTTGELTWTPTESDGPGTYTVSLRVTDSFAFSDTATFDLQVTEVNRPPVVTPTNRIAVAGRLLALTITATDPDIPAQELTYSLGNTAPPGSSITADGVVTWFPGADAIGTQSIPFQVSDGVDTSAGSITIQVAPEPLIQNGGYDNTTGQLSVTFPSLPGASYQLESSPDLDTFEWTPAASITATSQETTLIHNPSEDHLVYRLLILR